MVEIILLSLVLGLALVVFWSINWRTGFFSTRYYVQIALLLLIGVLGWSLAYVSWPAHDPVRVVVLLVSGAVVAYHVGLLGFKLLLDSDNKYRWIHKANRALVRYEQPHERFILRTEDGVRIVGVSLCNNACAPKKAVIVCHGAGRSKNTLSIVQTCSILATQYHVFTFDFRGHMESGGIFRANDDTRYDLAAVIKHVQCSGYEKIAVVGWSMGATTALLAAAHGSPIQAIIAGSPPPVSLGEYKHLRLLKRLPVIGFPGGSAAATSRYMRVSPGRDFMNALDFADLVPSIPILMVYNDYDNALNLDASAFERLRDKLPATTEVMRLPGIGHLFDWPNTYFFWNKMLDWLSVHF